MIHFFDNFFGKCVLTVNTRVTGKRIDIKPMESEILWAQDCGHLSLSLPQAKQLTLLLFLSEVADTEKNSDWQVFFPCHLTPKERKNIWEIWKVNLGPLALQATAL